MFKPQRQFGDHFGVREFEPTTIVGEVAMLAGHLPVNFRDSHRQFLRRNG
jgi:hypothetical protein